MVAHIQIPVIKIIRVIVLRKQLLLTKAHSFTLALPTRREGVFYCVKLPQNFTQGKRKNLVSPMIQGFNLVEVRRVELLFVCLP